MKNTVRPLFKIIFFSVTVNFHRSKRRRYTNDTSKDNHFKYTNRPKEALVENKRRRKEKKTHTNDAPMNMHFLSTHASQL